MFCLDFDIMYNPERLTCAEALIACYSLVSITKNAGKVVESPLSIVKMSNVGGSEIKV